MSGTPADTGADPEHPPEVAAIYAEHAPDCVIAAPAELPAAVGALAARVVGAG